MMLGAAITLASSDAATAANKIFLKFPGIEGTSASENHRREIEITGFSANASRTLGINFGGGSAGRVTCGQITLAKLIDQSSPEFLRLLFSGAMTGGPVVLSFEKAGEGDHLDYYKIELADVLVMSISQTDPEDTIVTEKIVLQAGKYRYIYTPQDERGRTLPPVSFGWDCRLGRQL